jgi:signal transduction histidine kinase
LDPGRFVVLSVNDDSASRDLVSRTLRQAGFQVIEAEDGETALRRAREHPQPDIIVLDVKLQSMGGFEVCRQIKSSPDTEHIKVLHTSATYVTAARKIEGLDAGADGYLAQPFENEELLANVRALARLQEAERELRERASRLAEMDRRKDEFLAMLSHELRNPLAAITIAQAVLKESPSRNEREQMARDLFARQTRQLTRIVDDLLEVARVSRGRIVLHLEALDLGALLKEVSESFRVRLAETGWDGDFEVNLPVQRMMVRGDHARLEQVFDNLLDNAMKYSGGKDKIAIHAKVEGQRVLVSVSDQGEGIDPEHLDVIFDLFSQGDATLARSRGGLGIGLTLVKQLLSRHDGTIRARSEGRGRGAEFVVELPLEPETPPVAEPVPINHGELIDARGRVMVVEDNPDSRQLLTYLLEAWGLEVVTASDGPSALDLARSSSPRFAIIDIGLPVIDGYEVARRLREDIGDRIYLVALTGYGSAADRERALAAGFDEHLTKPAPIDRLRSLLCSGANG